MSTRWLGCFFAILAVPMAAHAQASGARCLSAFLSSDGDWHARSFDGRAVEGDAFAPVEALFVRNGHLYARVWHSEPTSARIKADGNALPLKVFYPATLPGIHDATAKRLQPYGSAPHRLVIPGPCTAPQSLRIAIGKAGATHLIEFVRVPTSAVEFQAPASWDW